MSVSDLSSYSRFLLENHLTEFVNYQLSRAKEDNVPLLNVLSHLSPKELFKLVFDSNRKYLEGIIDNTVVEDTKENIRMWKRDELSFIGKSDIGIKDIIVSHKLRREGLIVYLKHYTTDVEKYEKILLEIESLYFTITEITFTAFMEVQQEILLKEKHLTDKVLDSSLSSIVAMEAVRDENQKIKDFKYVVLNSAAQRSLGPEAEFVGASLLEKFPSMVKEGIFSKYVKTVETGESFDMVFKYTHEGFDNWLRQVVVKWNDGLVITTDDITALKNSEEKIKNLNVTLEEKINERTKELQIKNKELKKINEDLDNFIYTASHDLKAPVSNLEGLVIALSEIIGENGSSLSEKKEMIGLMETSINRFKNTIHDLTDITKTQKQFDEELEEVNLEEVLEDAIHLNQEGIEASGAVFQIDLKSCKSIKFSRANLKSIFYNLINNAIKYRSPGRQPEIEISCVQESEFTFLKVRDNGLGISQHHLGKIFSMFKRFHSHVEGSGIGLYLVKRMVENAGGTIEVSSKENKGTTFKICLRNVS